MPATSEMMSGVREAPMPRLHGNPRSFVHPGARTCCRGVTITSNGRSDRGIKQRRHGIGPWSCLHLAVRCGISRATRPRRQSRKTRKDPAKKPVGHTQPHCIAVTPRNVKLRTGGPGCGAAPRPGHRWTKWPLDEIALEKSQSECILRTATQNDSGVYTRSLAP